MAKPGSRWPPRRVSPPPPRVARVPVVGRRWGGRRLPAHPARQGDPLGPQGRPRSPPDPPTSPTPRAPAPARPLAALPLRLPCPRAAPPAGARPCPARPGDGERGGREGGGSERAAAQRPRRPGANISLCGGSTGPGRRPSCWGRRTRPGPRGHPGSRAAAARGDLGLIWWTRPRGKALCPVCPPEPVPRSPRRKWSLLVGQTLSHRVPLRLWEGGPGP